MKTTRHIGLLAVLFAWGVGGLSAQSVSLPVTGDAELEAYPGHTYTIYDNGGRYGNYSNNANGTLTVHVHNNAAIVLTGSLRTEADYDYLTISEKYERQSVVLGIYSGVVTTLQATSAARDIVFAFHSDGSVNQSGFAIYLTVCDTTSRPINNIVIDSISTDAALVRWADNSGATQWTVHYGTDINNLDDSVVSSNTQVHLTGLQGMAVYYVSITNNQGYGQGGGSLCTKSTTTFTTECVSPTGRCIDISSFATCGIEAHFGTFQNPDAYWGTVDAGSQSGMSRHTIHTNPNETDPRTNHQLHTVPTGYSQSVRLGNWNTGGQAESITYEYAVDTNINDLFIMKYAAVLEDPDHTPTSQPRFTFVIMDSTGVPINSNCYAANFIANASLGWNNNSGVLWKDWTTVGVDLTPLHGQTIRIKLTTYDCSLSAHYGYSYFVFDCGQKAIRSSNCGSTVENTFTAPEGFNYRWFRIDAPTATLGTTQSLHVTQAGEYHCELQFVGAGSNTPCSFEMVAVAGERYPVAIVGYQLEDSTQCNPVVRLLDNSVISTDYNHQHLTTLPCEGTEWLVDDSVTLEGRNPAISLTPGAHSVRLVASLGGGACTDTAWRQIVMPNPCASADTVEAAICQGDSYRLFDTVVRATGIYVRDSMYLHRTLLLTVNSLDTVAVADTVVENSLPHLFADTLFADSTVDFPFHLADRNGCDSTVRYTLHVWRNVHSEADSTLCENDLPVIWNGVTFSGNDTVTATLAGAESHGADSLVTMRLHMLANSGLTRHDTVVENSLPVAVGGISFGASHADTSWTVANAAGCDSTITYSLHVWPNVRAEADSTVCEGSLPLVWNGESFTGPDSVTTNLGAVGLHGEDSTLTMQLNVLYNSSYERHDTVVENDLPVNFGGRTFSAAAAETTWTIANAAGCDSVLRYSLHVWHNYSHTRDTSVCDDALPLRWNDTLFTEAGSIRLLYYSIHGADSLVTLTLHVNNTYTVADTSVLCDGDSDPFGHSIEGDYEHLFQTAASCDSLLRLHVTVHPVYLVQRADTICDNQSVLFDGATVNVAGHHEAHHLTADNCDSTLTLELTVHPTSMEYEHAVVCDGVPYTWKDGVTYTSTTYEPTITYSDRNGCDSVLRLVLDLADNFAAAMRITPTLVDYARTEVRLADISDSRSRTWYFDDRTDTMRTVTLSYPMQRDSMEVLMVAQSTIGCIDSAWGMVRLDKAILWAPNTFTPDESTNSRFFIPSNEIAGGEVWVYNRQGVLMAHFDALEGWWDGTTRGIPCPQGSYVWTMRYTTNSQPRVERQATGTVTLLR